MTNPVVSQVNPHVHLFFFAPRGSAGKPVAHRKGKGEYTADPIVLVNLSTSSTSRLEREFPFIGCRTMAETRINEELQGDPRS